MPAKRFPARMTLELPAKARTHLERLARDTDQSLSETIRRALQIYSLIASEIRDGSTLRLERNGDSVEIVLPEFN